MRAACSVASTSVRAFHLTRTLERGRYPFFNKHRKVTDPAKQDPDYFEKQAKALPLDEHYVDALKMLWEDKIGSEREVDIKKDDNLIGDKETFGLPKVDPKAPRGAYKLVDELRDAPESVRRIFSVEFGHRQDLSAEWKNILIGKVAAHSLDSKSHEFRIAYFTALIRHWSLIVDDIAKRTPKKPKQLTRRILLTVERRRRLLRELREIDSEAFERVIHELKIAYSVPKQPEHVKTRKAWSEAQLRQRVEAEKEKRLEELHLSYMKGREEKMAAMKKRKEEIEEERRQLEKKMEELAILEGKATPNVKGKYQPQLVGSLSETVMHQALFYHPKPDMVKNY